MKILIAGYQEITELERFYIMQSLPNEVIIVNEHDEEVEIQSIPYIYRRLPVIEDVIEDRKKLKFNICNPHLRNRKY